MIRAIVALGKWLDARFPAKVTITQEGFDNLLGMYKDIKAVQVAISQVVDRHEYRMAKAEDSIKAIKDAMTKAPTMAAQVRADYIRSGRMPE